METATMPFSHDSQHSLPERLIQEHDEYRRLAERHRSFEERLERLNSRHILNDEEKVEAITLKKHKLALKDRMAEIARGFNAGRVGGAGR